MRQENKFITDRQSQSVTHRRFVGSTKNFARDPYNWVLGYGDPIFQFSDVRKIVMLNISRASTIVAKMNAFYNVVMNSMHAKIVSHTRAILWRP